MQLSRNRCGFQHSFLQFIWKEKHYSLLLINFLLILLCIFYCNGRHKNYYIFKCSSRFYDVENFVIDFLLFFYLSCCGWAWKIPRNPRDSCSNYPQYQSIYKEIPGIKLNTIFIFPQQCNLFHLITSRANLVCK